MDGETAAASEWVPPSAAGKTPSLLNHSSLYTQHCLFLSSPVPLVPSFSHRALCVRWVALRLEVRGAKQQFVFFFPFTHTGAEHGKDLLISLFAPARCWARSCVMGIKQPCWDGVWTSEPFQTLTDSPASQTTLCFCVWKWKHYQRVYFLCPWNQPGPQCWYLRVNVVALQSAGFKDHY